ncbi:hypothetical protein LX32DRAFT_287208 [Colletotrichum zoysiae]|uniref:Uncharacterized protein n=1 Tax=Colletotrichum zoysiae TaxID=1216348 RepID=A0AAD9H3K7_9PEZI|nr:hypothetical protein LX32DRAFT_287208 [Colletotrichum zoysiae]
MGKYHRIEAEHCACDECNAVQHGEINVWAMHACISYIFLQMKIIHSFEHGRCQSANRHHTLSFLCRMFQQPYVAVHISFARWPSHPCLTPMPRSPRPINVPGEGRECFVCGWRPVESLRLLLNGFFFFFGTRNLAQVVVLHLPFVESRQLCIFLHQTAETPAMLYRLK